MQAAGCQVLITLSFTGTDSMPGPLLGVIHTPLHVSSYQSYEAGIVIIIPILELRELKNEKLRLGKV